MKLMMLELPNLMELQRRSYDEFLQDGVLPEDRKKIGLQAAFTSVFPIYDSNENSFLEFAGYSFGLILILFGQDRRRLTVHLRLLRLAAKGHAAHAQRTDLHPGPAEIHVVHGNLRELR